MLFRSYWERPAPHFQQAIRRGPWKAVRPGPDAAIRLFDLGDDPGETRDVAAEHPEVAAALGEALAAGHAESPNWPDSKPDAAAARDHGPSPSPGSEGFAAPPSAAAAASSPPRPAATTLRPKA